MLVDENQILTANENDLLKVVKSETVPINYICFLYNTPE